MSLNHVGHLYAIPDIIETPSRIQKCDDCGDYPCEDCITYAPEYHVYDIKTTPSYKSGYGIHITNIDVTMDVSYEKINELGKIGPYLEYSKFPLDIKMEIQNMTPSKPIKCSDCSDIICETCANEQVPF